MDLQFTPEEQAFRAEVRDFLKGHLPKPLAAKSRLLRARDRLRQQLSLDCQVRLDSSGRVCCFTPAVK